MTPIRKKLIEVALPLAAISDSAAHEKDIHTGLPANFHAWWSRKPLTAARAVLLASILDDPGDSSSSGEADDERARLLDLVARVAALVPGKGGDDVLKEASTAIRHSIGSRLPVFYDPFCGGGSLPLEAQRLGLDVVAGDLNPVAVLLTRTMTSLLPPLMSHKGVRPSANAVEDSGPYQSIMKDTEYYAQWMAKKAEKQVGSLYPKVTISSAQTSSSRPPTSPPIAWLWTRTVRCPNPACQGTSPLANKFWLSTHVGNEAWANPIPDKASGIVRFSVETRGSPPAGNVTSKGAVCLICGNPIPFSHVRAEGVLNRLGFQLMGVVVAQGRRRVYLSPRDVDSTAAKEAKPNWIPETDLPPKALGFRVQNYGITRHADLFLPRQLASIGVFSTLVDDAYHEVLRDSDGDQNYARAIVVLLALSVDRLAQTNNTLVRWLVRKSGTSKGTPAFDRPIVSMSWEFSEGNVFGNSVGSWEKAYKNVLSSIKSFSPVLTDAHVAQADASQAILNGSRFLVSTDPPYFDNIGYSNLSDFFYIWLRRSLRGIMPDIFGTVLVPKAEELVASRDAFHGDDVRAEAHFMMGLQSAFRQMRDCAHPSFPLTVYYAFKQSEKIDTTEDSGFASTGWEKLLDALIGAGLSVTGTWPIRTEQRARLRAIGSNALASSIVLVCRKRSEDAPTVTRADFRRLLRTELPAAIKNLQKGNIAPVDMAQASIGPGMAIFSRHSKVLEADGTSMTVRTALQLINQALDEYLTEQEGEFDRDTRFAVTWFEAHTFDAGAFGEAETLAKARNVSVDGVVEAGVLHAAAGKVRLLRRSELADEWDPSKDKRLTVWEAAQHLIKRLETKGEPAAAELLAQLGSKAAPARDLAYRLYTTCERKGWAEEARAYNGLVVAWPELEKLATQSVVRRPVQTDLL